MGRDPWQRGPSALAACAPAVDSGSTACDDAMAAAAAVDENSDTVADLYPAVRACQTLAEWTAASDAHPTALDGANAKLFAQNACANGEGLADEPLCVEVGAPYS